MTTIIRATVVVQVAGALVVEAVAEVAVVAVAEVVVLKRKKIMKKVIYYSFSIFLSILWLKNNSQVYNPLYLKGPVFLKFYLLLIFTFCILVVLRKKIIRENSSKATIYFYMAIVLLGIVKLIRGITLGKPVGYLIAILFIEMTALIIILSRQKNINN